MSITTHPPVEPITSREERVSRLAVSRDSANTPDALLLSLGTAVPPMCWSQQVAADRIARLWNLTGKDLDRWRRIIDGCGIDQRHGVMIVDDVMPLSTAQRMAAYEHHAPPLAHEAAAQALARAGVAPHEITDLIIVSCTGFSAPGVDVALVERLGLPRTTRRTIVGFMGCFGAIIGLRAAINACQADHRNVALVVCVELSSLHLRADSGAQNMVASALFADGAAAAIVAGNIRRSAHSERGEEVWDQRSNVGRSLSHPVAPPPGHPLSPSSSPPLGRLASARTLLIPEGRDWMTWRITDAGFAMTLTRDVPVALRRAIADFVDDACDALPGSFIVHPGGVPILDAVDDALQLNGGSGLASARHVLHNHGNMSSPTVLFVLEHALTAGHRPPALLLAFGPGLTIESLRLESSADGAT